MNDLTEEELANLEANLKRLFAEPAGSLRQSMLASLASDALPRLLAEVRRHREYQARLAEMVERDL